MTPFAFWSFLYAFICVRPPVCSEITAQNRLIRHSASHLAGQSNLQMKYLESALELVFPGAPGVSDGATP